ncbi:hypothetical protein OF83DRAFT_1171305 [Amylostereum chailletii]|nr:hypothetical protein OF83DRAFT_1171305 [Amylostereum chailletii]
MQSTSGEKRNEPATVPMLHHDEFYISDQLSIFQVEDRLFRVHRHFLSKHSPVFRDMFALPVPPTSTAVYGEGDSDEHPIHLPGLRSFLASDLNPNSCQFWTSSSQDPNFLLSQAEWISVLSIANRFDLRSMHKRATQNLCSARSDAEIIALLVAAERHGIAFANISDALRAIIRREKELDAHEFETMSSTLVSQVVRARERWIRGKHRASGPAFDVQLSEDELLDKILKVVWDVP